MLTLIVLFQAENDYSKDKTCKIFFSGFHVGQEQEVIEVQDDDFRRRRQLVQPQAKGQQDQNDGV